MSIAIEKSQTGPTRWVLRAAALYVFLFYLVVYTVVHEAGHVLVGLLFGQTVTEFSISFWNFTAHVTSAGTLTPPQRAIQLAAGTGLPLLVWVLVVGAAPRRVNLLAHLLRLLGSVGVLGTLLAWIVIPLFRLFGTTNVRDDVTNFLNTTGIPPLLLSAVSAGLLLLGWGFFTRRAGRFSVQAARIRTAGQADLAGLRTAVLVTGFFLLVAVLIGIAADRLAARNLAQQAAPPEGYRLAARRDLSVMPYENETLADFSLGASHEVGVYFSIENIDTESFTLSLVRMDGFRKVLTAGKGWRANQVTGLEEMQLLPGDYQVLLNASQSPGTVSVYIDYP